MTITTLPTKTDGSIGRVKIDKPGVALTSLDYQVPAAELERLKTAIVDVSAEVGLSDGTTAGSLRESVVMMRKVRDRLVSSDAIISSETDDVLRVNTSGGGVKLCLPKPEGKRLFHIKKITANTVPIPLYPEGAESIEGTPGALALPGSAATNMPSWTVYSDGTDWWLI